MATAMRGNLTDKSIPELGNEAKKMGQNLQEQAKETTEQAAGFATAATQKVKDAASFVGEKAEKATEAVGCGIESAGSSLREHLPETGALHRAGEAIADTLESSGRYLEHHGLSGIGNDLTQMIRKNPIPALLIGIGLGFCLARFARR